MKQGEPVEDGRRARNEVSAGEYVPGVLSAQARRRVEQRMSADRSFAIPVERWQMDFSSFDEDYQETAQAAALFARIERRLFAQQPSSVATRLWNAAGFRRWISLGTSAVAVGALLYASGAFHASSTGGPVVAQFSVPDNPLNLLASFDTSSGRSRIIPAAAGKPQERSLQLWLVRKSGAPRSLGFFQPGAEDERLVPTDLRYKIAASAKLAVSLEPFGGSPTALPAGPVVASGTARQL